MKNTELLIVLFNLKKSAKVEDYEAYAKNVDSPAIRSLNSNKSFTILKGLHLFGSDEPSPYQYIEVMEVTNFKELADDIKQSHIQNMLNMFMEFADDPKLILTQKVA